MPVTGLKPLGIGRSKYHDYYVDASTYERWEHVYNNKNMLIRRNRDSHLYFTSNTTASVAG